MNFLWSLLRPFLIKPSIAKWQIHGENITSLQVEWTWLRMKLQTDPEWICLADHFYSHQGVRLASYLALNDSSHLGPVLREPHHPKSLPPLRNLEQNACSILMMVPWMAVGGADAMDWEILHILREVGCNVTVITEEGFIDREVAFDFFPLRIFPKHKHAAVLDYLSETRKPSVIYCRNSMACYQYSTPIYKIDLNHNNGPWLRRSSSSNLDCRLAISRQIAIKGPCRRILRGFISQAFSALPPGDARLVWIGRMEEEKDPLGWVNVFSHSPFEEGVMIGTGSLVSQIPNMEGLTLTRRFLATAEMMAILNSNDVLLLTSKMEGLPLVVLECLQMGMRVVMPPVGAWLELKNAVKTDRLIITDNVTSAIDLLHSSHFLTTAPNLRRFGHRRFRRNVLRAFLTKV